jgi:hypothetical protein
MHRMLMHEGRRNVPREAKENLSRRENTLLADDAIARDGSSQSQGPTETKHSSQGSSVRTSAI